MKTMNLLLAAGVTVLCACTDTRSLEPIHSVAVIAAKPLEWQGRTVRLRGKVTTLLAMPFSDSAYYELDDGSAKIMVETTKGLPAKGETVAIQGVVRSKVVIGDFSVGLMVSESGRI